MISSPNLAKAKRDLRLAVSSPSSSRSIPLAIRTVESLTPHPDPLVNAPSLIAGTWVLLHTSRDDASLRGTLDEGNPLRRLILETNDAAYRFFYQNFPLIAGSAVRSNNASSSVDREQDEEQAWDGWADRSSRDSSSSTSTSSSGFFPNLPIPPLFPRLRIGGNFQDIVLPVSNSSGQVTNRVRFQFQTPGSEQWRRGFFEVTGDATIVPASSTPFPASFPAASTSMDLRVTFASCRLVVEEAGGGGERVLVSLSLRPLSPVGYVRTTYVDEGLRIGRGDKGSVFVTRRVKGM